MRQIALFFFPVLFISTFGASVVYAQTQPKVSADHVANVFEKLKEKVTMFFKFSQEEKFEYLAYLSEKRLGELKYVIDSKQGNLIEETSSRYSTYLGNLTEYAISHKMTNKKEELKNLYDQHQKILEQLNTFEYESGFWLLLMHNLNITKIYATQVVDHL